MPPRLDDHAWLGHLVDEELERYDPVTARARLPQELTALPGGQDLAPGAQVLVARSLRHRSLAAAPDHDEAFLSTVRAHVWLVLDVALLAGAPFHRDRRRAAIAACLAAALDEPGLALDADPGVEGSASPRAVDRALRAAGKALLARTYPPGDPLHGLPLYTGALAVLRRHLARAAAGAHRHGRLDPEALARHRAFAQRELVLLVEALAGLLAACAEASPDHRPDDTARGVRRRQLGRLGLPAPEAREARRAMAAPRPAAILAAAAPERVRRFLYEQLLLARLRARLPAAPAEAYAAAFLEGAGLGAQDLVAALVEAQAQHDDHLAWYQAIDGGGGPDWEALAGEWEATADEVVEKVTDAVSHNLEAVVTEIRETGELGGLLAKAAAGRGLSADEKRKVKAQLIDLAKAVPALAIFAAPGGMLLLPLLAKLLPFNVLPSAWEKRAPGDAAATSARPAPPAAAEGAPAAATPPTTGEPDGA